MKELASNGLSPIIAQAIEEMKAEQGKNFSLEKINLAELERRTGLSRAKLRRLKEHGFRDTPHGLIGHKPSVSVLSGYSGLLDKLLQNGISNSAVCFKRLEAEGYSGSQTAVKRYIASHRHLIPAKRQLVAHKATAAGGTPPNLAKHTR